MHGFTLFELRKGNYPIWPFVWSRVRCANQGFQGPLWVLIFWWVLYLILYSKYRLKGFHRFLLSLPAVTGQESAKGQPKSWFTGQMSKEIYRRDTVQDIRYRIHQAKFRVPFPPHWGFAHVHVPKHVVPSQKLPHGWMARIFWEGSMGNL